MRQRHIIILLGAVSFSALSCGNGDVEVIKADSTVTSASMGKAIQPDPVNTDTTTAAPSSVIDTSRTVKDTAAVTFPVSEKKKQPAPKTHGAEPRPKKNK